MEDHAHSFARTWPVKTRDLHNHHFDSTFWDDIRFRDDDIVIATYAKSGTTWMQQIVSQLIFDGAEGISTAACFGRCVDLSAEATFSSRLEGRIIVGPEGRHVLTRAVRT